MDLVIWDKSRKIPKVELSIKEKNKPTSKVMDEPKIKNEDFKTCKKKIKIADIKINVFMSANNELSFDLKYGEIKKNHAGFDISKFPKIEFTSEIDTNMEVDNKRKQIEKSKINVNKNKIESNTNVFKNSKNFGADDGNIKLIKIDLFEKSENKKNTKKGSEFYELIRKDTINKFGNKAINNSDLRLKKSNTPVEGN
jgi:hypothetical protein